MTEIRIAVNYIPGTAFLPGETSYGHLQLVKYESEELQTEIEVQGEWREGYTWFGEWVFSVPKNHLESSNYGDEGEYFWTLLDIGDRQAEDFWGLLYQINTQYVSLDPQIDYNIDKNSNSYVTTILWTLGIDVFDYEDDLIEGVIDGIPGIGTNIQYVLDDAIPIALTGTVGTDTFRGGLVVDTFSGSFGSDTLLGGDGNDILAGHRIIQIGEIEFDEDGRAFTPAGAVEALYSVGEDLPPYIQPMGDRLIGGLGHDKFVVSNSYSFVATDWNGDNYEIEETLALSSSGVNPNIYKMVDVILDPEGGDIDFYFWNVELEHENNYANRQNFFGSFLQIDAQVAEAVSIHGFTTYRVMPATLTGANVEFFLAVDLVTDENTGIMSNRVLAYAELWADGVRTGDTYGLFAIDNFFNGAFGLTILGYVASYSGSNADDLIEGTVGQDDIAGNEGDDVLNGLGGDDIITGAIGDDTIDGGGGADAIEGGAGNDFIDGGDGDDILLGGGGDDVLRAGTGDNVLDGGDGNYDQADLNGYAWDYVFTSNQDGSVTATSQTHGTNTLLGIDGVWFLAEAAWYALPSLLTTSGSGTINGTAGDDYLTGSNGDDAIYGGDGQDTLYGGYGDDTLFGGGGAYNQADYDGFAADYTFTLNGDGSVTVTSVDYGTDILHDIGGIWFRGEAAWYSVSDLHGNGWEGNVDEIETTAGTKVVLNLMDNDVIPSGANANHYIWTQPQHGSIYWSTASQSYVYQSNADFTGVDTLIYGVHDGDNGNEVMTPSGVSVSIAVAAQTTVSGTTGADVLNGASAGERMIGGTGSDTLTGGDGHDTFVFLPNFGHDTIEDFAGDEGEGDLIEISASVFADFSALIAASQQVGADTLITHDIDNTLTLSNVALSSLHGDDFRFVV